MRDRYAEYAMISATEHYRAMSRQLQMAIFNKHHMTEQRLESYLAPL